MRAALIGLLALCGCDAAVYGMGSLYLYNGTEHAVRIAIAGRTPGEASLKPERGELLEDIVAGPYVLSVDDRTIAAEVKREQLAVVNVDGAGCFARLDVIGMYQPGKEPVRVLETYDASEVLSIADLIAVRPGERLPSAAPKTTFPYQRLVVVPCHLLEDEGRASGNVAEYARRLR